MLVTVSSQHTFSDKFTPLLTITDKLLATIIMTRTG